MNRTFKILSLLILVICFKTVSEIRKPGQSVSIQMELQKSIYKEFEPVIAKFVLVNNDSEPYNIYTMFNPYCSETNIDITDNIGHHWFQNNSQGDYIIINEPTYILQPEDTLVVSMAINNWGEKLAQRYSLYSQFGFFPPGRKYKAALFFNELRSNQVEFEIDSLNDGDKKLVQLYNDIYGKITRDSAAIIAETLYPDNIFTEYLSAEGIEARYYSELRKDKNNPLINALIEDYENFFNKYPHSNYFYKDDFMWAYYFNIFYNKPNLKKILTDLSEKNKNNKLGEVLRYRSSYSRIKLILERVERALFK